MSALILPVSETVFGAKFYCSKCGASAPWMKLTSVECDARGSHNWAPLDNVAALLARMQHVRVS